MANEFQYTPFDPNTSKLKGLMTTDYGQLQKDLQAPGDLQINKSFDKSGYNIRDVMGGGGLYGSSIQADAMNDNTLNRSNALASNAANAGATVAGLKSQENQWLGNKSLNENQFLNTLNMGESQFARKLLHDIEMANLGYGFQSQYMNQMGENAEREGRGKLLGIGLQGLMDNWSSIFGKKG